MINTIYDQVLSPTGSPPGITGDPTDDLFALAKQPSCQTPKIEETSKELSSAEVLRGRVRADHRDDKCDFPGAQGIQIDNGNGLAS